MALGAIVQDRPGDREQRGRASSVGVWRVQLSVAARGEDVVLQGLRLDAGAAALELGRRSC